MSHYSMRLVSASPEQVDSLPSAIRSGDRTIRATLVQAAFVNLGYGGEQHVHLAGYVLPGRIRLTSRVLGYDPDNLLVETENSLYRVCAPIVDGADQDLLTTAMIIAMGMGDKAITTPPGLN